MDYMHMMPVYTATNSTSRQLSALTQIACIKLNQNVLNIGNIPKYRMTFCIYITVYEVCTITIHFLMVILRIKL